jgi:hypothetical protein
VNGYMAYMSENPVGVGGLVEGIRGDLSLNAFEETLSKALSRRPFFEGI